MQERGTVHSLREIKTRKYCRSIKKIPISVSRASPVGKVLPEDACDTAESFAEVWFNDPDTCSD
jgi:hypothetical protein